MPIFTAILLTSPVIGGSLVFIFLKYLQTRRDIQAILKTTQWLAAIYAGAISVLTIVSAAQLVFNRQAADTALPISPWLPDELNIQSTGSGTVLENLRFETVTADAMGIPLDAALLMASSAILSGIMQVSVALGFRALARGHLNGVPFRSQFTRVTQTLAWIVLICGLMAPVLEGFGTSALAAESLIAWELTDGLSSAPTANLAIFINFWPIGVFLALYTLSAILNSGEQLQKSTEGLV